MRKKNDSFYNVRRQEHHVIWNIQSEIYNVASSLYINILPHITRYLPSTDLHFDGQTLEMLVCQKQYKTMQRKCGIEFYGIYYLPLISTVTSFELCDFDLDLHWKVDILKHQITLSTWYFNLFIYGL